MDHNYHLVINKMLLTVRFKIHPNKKKSLICIVTTKDKKHKDILFPVYSKNTKTMKKKAQNGKNFFSKEFYLVNFTFKRN